MKNYKLLLIVIVLLLLLILTGVMSWLWFNNNKDNDPLPIMTPQAVTSQNVNGIETSENQGSETANNTVYIRAEQPLQIPLDAVIVRFESRHPQVQIKANYVTTAELLELSDTTSTDVIIADHKLPAASITKLQDDINTKTVHSETLNKVTQENNKEMAEQTVENKSRMLTSFSYAIKESQLMDGIVLTDKPLAINFRNFIISSSGQDILQQYDYDNIDGYKNSVDDLFNPNSKSKTTVDQTKVVANALENSE